MAKTTLKSSAGYYVCAEGGGGMYAVADRPAVGPWEEWTLHTYDDGRVSLQADNGMYLTAELDEKTVNIRAQQSGEWERFTYEVRDDQIVAFKSYHGTYLQAPSGGGANSRIVQVGSDPNLPGEWEFFASSLKFWKPSIPVCTRPLVGPLRIESKCFRDDSGFRRVFFCSWFPALRVLKDNPNEFYRQLNSIVEAGYQGVRVFASVGGWSTFWDGREVVPVTFTKWFWTGNTLRTDQYGATLQAWPEYDDLLRTLLRECKKRKLRLHVAVGDAQIITPDPATEVELHKRVAKICAEEGGLEVVALVGDTNEFPINHAGGDSDSSIDQLGKVVAAWQSAIPGVITGIGAILSEEPDQLYRSVKYGSACITHTSRDPFELCLKRTLGLVYWEGDWRHFSHPFWQSEPAGPGEDSFARQDSPPNLVALYALHALTGQASNRFQGAAVRANEPLESEWGFFELPEILSIIPEDIVTWEHASNQRGGSLYWFKNKDFFTVTFSEWDPSPPKPIESWTLYTGDGIFHGTGNPYHGNKRLRGAARATGLAVGKFV